MPCHSLYKMLSVSHFMEFPQEPGRNRISNNGVAFVSEVTPACRKQQTISGPQTSAFCRPPAWMRTVLPATLPQWKPLSLTAASLNHSLNLPSPRQKLPASQIQVMPFRPGQLTGCISPHGLPYSLLRFTMKSPKIENKWQLPPVDTIISSL